MPLKCHPVRSAPAPALDWPLPALAQSWSDALGDARSGRVRRVLLFRWLCVTRRLVLREPMENPRPQRSCHMHGAVSRGPLLSREQHFARAVRRHDGGFEGFAPETVLSGRAGSRSDTSRLRHWRRGRRTVEEAPCEPGYRCHLGVRRRGAGDRTRGGRGGGAASTAQCGPRPLPVTIVRGATGAAKPCPAGTYGNVIGNETGLTTAACSGPCFRGHYCPEGSVLPTPW